MTIHTDTMRIAHRDDLRLLRRQHAPIQDMLDRVQRSPGEWFMVDIDRASEAARVRRMVVAPSQWQILTRTVDGRVVMFMRYDELPDPDTYREEEPF